MAQAKKEKSRGVDSGWVGPKALNNRRWSSFQEVNFLINVQAASACDLENYSYSQTKQRSSFNCARSPLFSRAERNCDTLRFILLKHDSGEITCLHFEGCYLEWAPVPAALSSEREACGQAAAIWCQSSFRSSLLLLPLEFSEWNSAAVPVLLSSSSAHLLLRPGLSAHSAISLPHSLPLTCQPFPILS